MRALATVALCLALGEVERPGGPLTAGTRLIYESGGTRTTWIVDSVRADSGVGCETVWIRRDASAEERRDCVRDGALHRWDARTSSWVEQRPVAAGLVRSYRRGAVRSEFQTHRVLIDTISGRAFPVVETTVLTFDSTGAVRRRLPERYSIGLTSATSGVFEVPDSAAASGWSVRQEFRLVAVER
jgi:hypothetical protein